jgi:hypothetical protein
MRDHSHYCPDCKRDRPCYNSACLVATVQTCANCERFNLGKPIKTLVLTVQTFFKSCPDARHYYGTIRQNGKVVREVERSGSRVAVIRSAENWLERRMNRKNTTSHYRLVVKQETENL